MVVHIVLFQFKDEAKPRLDEAVAAIQGMVGQVPVIRNLMAGKDFLHSGRSYDLGLVVVLDDRHALEVYDAHPAHQPVKALLKPLYQSAVAVDFEA